MNDTNVERKEIFIGDWVRVKATCPEDEIFTGYRGIVVNRYHCENDLPENPTMSEIVWEAGCNNTRHWGNNSLTICEGDDIPTKLKKRPPEYERLVYKERFIDKYPQLYSQFDQTR